MKTKFLMLFMLAFALGGVLHGQNNVTAEPSRGYLIGPDDVVEGKVLGEPEYDFAATVDQDGNIEVPFFDKPIAAQCRSERELRADVTKLVSKYLRSPQLSLRVTERKSRPPVTVSGEIRSPQLVELKRQARLLEILSFSGGTTDDAGGIIQVFRPRPPLCAAPEELADWRAGVSADTDVPSRVYSLASVRLGRDEANPIIYPGDVIVVQKASPVYINGEVNSPQGVLIKNGSLSLTQAIAQIGGFNREAKTKDIKIIRQKPNSQETDTIAVNYDLIRKGEQKDVMLQPYDIVQVGKTKKSVGQIVFETITGAARTGVTSLSTGGVTRVLY